MKSFFKKIGKAIKSGFKKLGKFFNSKIGKILGTVLMAWSLGLAALIALLIHFLLVYYK